MHVDRLKRLVKLLRADAKNPNGVKFDLTSWAVPSGEEAFKTPKRTVPVSCGTTACAFGLAAISGEFKEEGLRYSYYTRHAGYMLEPSICQGGEVYTGFGAACALFDIDDDEAEYLFDPKCYESVPQGAKGELLVARRIEDFIRNNGDIPDRTL